METTEQKIKEFCRDLEKEMIKQNKSGSMVFIENHPHYFDPLKHPNFKVSPSPVPGATEIGRTVAIRFGIYPEIKFEQLWKRFSLSRIHGRIFPEK